MGSDSLLIHTHRQAIRSDRTGRGRCVAWVLLLTAAGSLQAQELVPLGDPTEERAEPAGISTMGIELFGQMLYHWQPPDDENVFHYVGDFSLQMGRRRASAREAVLWLNRLEWKGRPYVRLEVFLWRDARMEDLAGTVTTGPMLLLTLNTFGKLDFNNDYSTNKPSADTVAYAEAVRARAALAEARSDDEAGPPRGVQVDRLGPAGVRSAPRMQSAVTIRPGKELVFDTRDGERIATAIGGVYISQGTVDSGQFLELQADSAALFLSEEQFQRGLQQVGDESGTTATDRRRESPRSGLGGELSGMVQAVYLEGDVVITRGERMIRAERLYYDFENDRALILDAVMRSFDPTRGLPIYVRAAQVRQLSRTEYVADQAKITTSEFFTPHYHIGAERVYLQDRTPRDAAGEIMGLEAGRYRMVHSTLNLEGVPIAYWPYSEGDFQRTETSLRGARVSFSDGFGAMFQTQWYLANLLGLRSPDGFDSTMHLDYFSKRGPAVGIDLDYEREDYLGLFRSYSIYDKGEDNLGGFRNNIEPDTDNRGRVLWRHRHILPDDWELSFEISYISDPNFLEEYRESEFDEGKEQETLLYLKKQDENRIFTLLTQFRVLDFTTQTERLPDLGFWWLGEPLGDVATFYNESRLGLLRYRPDNRRFFDSQRFRLDNTGRTDVVPRADTRNEVNVPLDLGSIRLVPFAMARGTAWGDSPRDGSLARIFGSYGLRTSSYLHRTFPGVKSELLDLNGIRHIIKPDITAWASHTNVDSHEITPFDEGVDDIDEFDGVTLGVRQRLQTKRGAPGKQRVVDWIMLDLELGLFNEAQGFEVTRGDVFGYRPENAVSRNFVNADFLYRISDSTAVLSDANFDLNDGDLDQYNISLAVERTPRFSYFVGWRYLREINSNLLGIGGNYRISAKHTLAVREAFDLQRGETYEFAVTYIRKFPRWYVALTFELDQVEDDFGISLSAWPEGAPQATLGARRYSGIPEFTGIRP